MRAIAPHGRCRGVRRQSTEQERERQSKRGVGGIAATEIVVVVRGSTAILGRGSVGSVVCVLGIAVVVWGIAVGVVVTVGVVAAAAKGWIASVIVIVPSRW